MPLVFFFSPQSHTTITIDIVLGRLKNSLRDTLSVFYPLAGRVKNTNHIACNDEGVPCVEAKVISAVRLKDIIHKAEVGQLDLLVPIDGQEGYTSLLLAIQVTTFPCGGLAIGAKMSHAISDAFSLLMFLKTWTSMANNGKDNLMLLPHPYFEISDVFPPHSLITDVPKEPNPDLLKDRPVAKHFTFSHAKLYTLRPKMCRERDLTRNLKSLPSLTMVLSAFIWSRMKVACDNVIPYEMYHAVSVRPKMIAPKQCYYFENMVVNAIVKPYMSLCNDIEFLDLLKESINRIILGSGLIREMEEGKEDLGFMLDHYEREIRGEIISLGFSNLRSLPAYEADFGWGVPDWVTSATLLGMGLVIVIPSGPSGKDIDAYINLSDEDMAKLESDNEFISYVPKTPNASSKDFTKCYPVIHYVVN